MKKNKNGHKNEIFAKIIIKKGNVSYKMGNPILKICEKKIKESKKANECPILMM